MAIKVADNTMEVKSTAVSIIEEIGRNAETGNPYTEIYVPKHIGMDVRKEISRRLDDDGTKYTWCVVRRGTNQFTGKAEYFTGEIIGDQRYYKIKILS